MMITIQVKSGDLILTNPQSSKMANENTYFEIQSLKIRIVLREHELTSDQRWSVIEGLRPLHQLADGIKYKKCGSDGRQQQNTPYSRGPWGTPRVWNTFSHSSM